MSLKCKIVLKNQAFFVNTEAHVKAVYTICILAYFINRYLSNQRKAIGEKIFKLKGTLCAVQRYRYRHS
ncbi:MAG: hypothetical protein HS127_04535 [Planctomycetia bacterium]|nr:hypothetical protein [Planctomycetia bacterium]